MHCPGDGYAMSNDQQEALFNEALKCPSAEARIAFLDDACRDNCELRARLDLLLEGFFKAEGFLGADTDVPQTTDDETGASVGRYKLLEKIGEGGFGVVYLAEQREPVKRRVALKIIKLGMDSRQVVARFEAERQALALMDHPNIAKVFDGGITEPLTATRLATHYGRPYFVMELVRGIAITHYCDEHQLAAHERLKLFVQVCDAVQHAHQKGIIHRDLKPSNILVTLNDGKAVPKVIDFGVAKATQQELKEKTVFTQFHHFIGTPAYMSPEQAEMTSVDIDTRSDIYALGVLLYELLTGQTPFDGKVLLAAGLDEMRRTICQKEPQRPSTRLSLLGSDEQTTTAQRRKSEPQGLIRLLRGDLDCIVMKCLEKDRGRRYETANGLVRDIERHLNNEPIVARRPSRLYRFQKLVRRNKLQFAAVSIVLAALVGGLGSSLWLLSKEKEARRRSVVAEKESKTQAARSQQVARFLEEMLEGVGPAVALGEDTKLLRRILESTANRISVELTNQVEVEAELRVTLGEVYEQLGEYSAAEAMHKEALRLRRARFGEENPAVAESLNNLASVLRSQGHLPEAESLARKSLETRSKFYGEEHPKVAQSLTSLASAIDLQGRFAEAEPLYRRALAIWRKLPVDRRATVAAILSNLGALLSDMGRPDEAEVALREALELKMKFLGPEAPGTAAAWGNLGLTLWNRGKYGEAAASQTEALRIWRKLGGNENENVSRALNNLGMVLYSQGKLSEAQARYSEALAIREKLVPPGHPAIANLIGNLALVLNDQGKYAEAEVRFCDVIDMIKKRLGNHPRLGMDLLNLATAQMRQEKFSDAENALREARSLIQKTIGKECRESALVAQALCATLREQGKLTEAETLGSEALGVWRKLARPETSDAPDSLEDLAAVLRRSGNYTNTEALLRESVELREKNRPDEWETFNARLLLGICLLEQNKIEQAQTVLKSGGDGIMRRKDAIPIFRKRDVELELKDVSNIYEAAALTDQAAEWKRRLAEYKEAVH